MRLSSPCLLLLASIGEETTTAFTPPSLINTRSRRHVVVPNTHHQRQQHLSMALSDLPGDIAAPPKKKVLTAADVMAKSKTSASGGTPNSNDPSAPGEQESPKLFSPAIYDDFQSALLALEKRIEGGPGSLSSEEVRKFEEETGRIAREMREYASDPKGTGEAIRKGYEMSAPAVDVVAKEEEEEEVAVVVAAAPAVTDDDDDVPPENYPPNEDEPTDAAQSYGLAKGTTNTYIIDGMAEMSPEEYRAKLQETISARQRKRRSTSLEGNRGIIGNASSQGYLDTLSGITGKNNGSPGNKKG
mmetsp:Transcript_16388/g.29603  ORF Transcript_16388/g.29603 Transcript_16388/m.29603 type:complete len:301 (-) Transcript_16388:226-1128(-)